MQANLHTYTGLPCCLPLATGSGPCTCFFTLIPILISIPIPCPTSHFLSRAAASPAAASRRLPQPQPALRGNQSCRGCPPDSVHGNFHAGAAAAVLRPAAADASRMRRLRCMEDRCATSAIAPGKATRRLMLQPARFGSIDVLGAPTRRSARRHGFSCFLVLSGNFSICWRHRC